jgi:hypothetical protein
MFKIGLPLPDSALQFIPQWNWLHPAWQILLLFLLCVVPITLVLWLYRYELKLVSRGTAFALLSLRLVVLALLLFLVCLQPVYAHTPSRELPGRVLIAIDRSGSMAVADPQRVVEDKLRLARALKLTTELTDAQLSEWADAVKEGKEPTWVKDEEIREEPACRRPLEMQRKEAYVKVLAEVDRLTRGEITRRVLGEPGADLLKKLGAKQDVELMAFDREGWDIRPDQLDELFQPSEKAKIDRKDEPDDKNKKPEVKKPSRRSDFTDLSVPLRKALERSGPGQGKVLGVILLTDGQHNQGDSPSALARDLGERSLPIYPIALGAQKPPSAVAVVSVKGPASVFKDIDATIDVRFKITNMEKQDFRVELRRPESNVAAPNDPGAVVAERIIHHDGKDREYHESFSVRMEKVGTQTITASVVPLNEVAKTVRLDRNHADTAINVADDKAKVLLIDGEAGWEFHYLSTLLKRDRTMQLTTVVFEQPRLDPRLTAAELEKLGSPQQQLPDGPEALAAFDCIIVGDVTEAQLPMKDRVRLEKYVADRGGTLVILGGKRAMPLAYPDAGPNGELDPLRKLLPIEAAHEESIKEGFQVTRTAQGRETRFLDLSSDPAKSDEYWSWLPKHYWAVIGRAKPGATALAFVPDPGAEPAKPSPEREKDRALIVRQNYGFGRVLFVGLDSTWRWRYMRGDERHHGLWGQTIRWAASDKPLVTGNEFVRFGTPQPVYRPDEPLQVIVRISEEAGALRPDMTAGARLIRLDGDKEEAVALLELNRREAQPRVLEGQLSNLPPGRYAIELVIPDLADKLRAGSPEPGQPDRWMRSLFTVLPTESREMIDLETRWPLLRELAATSGGKVFMPEDASELVDLLKQQSITQVDRYEQPLHRWWPTLVLLIALLTLEWVGRKWAGLP